jgi:heat shock protein HtpX
MSFFGGGRRDDRGNGNAIFLILAVVGIVLAPLAAKLIQLAVSRRREYLADASSALLTRYPEGLASALQKIGGYAAPMKSANLATAHLFIGDPFGAKSGGSAGWIERLFSTHPPIQDRIKLLLTTGAQ